MLMRYKYYVPASYDDDAWPICTLFFLELGLQACTRELDRLTNDGFQRLMWRRKLSNKLSYTSFKVSVWNHIIRPIYAYVVCDRHAG